MSMQSLRGPAPGRMLPSLPTPTGTPFQSWTREARSLPEDHTQIPPCPTSARAAQPAASPPSALCCQGLPAIEGCTSSSAAWTAHCTGRGPGAWAGVALRSGRATLLGLRGKS